MKSENGITYTKLLIIFVIIIIIGAILLSNIVRMFETEKFESIKTNMLLIQAEANVLKGGSDMKSDVSTLKGYQLSNLPEEIDIKKFLSKGLISEIDYEYYYILDQKCLNDMGLSKIVLDNDEYYIIDYETSEVFYTKGYTADDKTTYYKLSDFKQFSL